MRTVQCFRFISIYSSSHKIIKPGDKENTGSSLNIQKLYIIDLTITLGVNTEE